MADKQYDAIIVGLGCFGLGISYYLQKQGLKVLGFDKNPGPGALGTGSAGHGRIWRHMHIDPRYYEMQRESEEIIREIEKKTGMEILTPGGLLYVKPIGDKDINELLKYGVRMSAKEINEKWPALKIPEYLEGVYSTDAGVTKIKNALQGFRQESINLGADLRYSCKVNHIDHSLGKVTLENGEHYFGKRVIIACGAQTDKFYQKEGQFKMHKQLLHTYYLDNNKDLPPAFVIEGMPESNGEMVFGTLDGDNFAKYKVGHELHNNFDMHKMLEIMEIILPTKIQSITHVMPCYYSMSVDDEFIFEEAGPHTIYAFGCNGRGFKHIGFHGKRVYNMIIGNHTEANKYNRSVYYGQQSLAKL